MASSSREDDPASSRHLAGKSWSKDDIQTLIQRRASGEPWSLTAAVSRFVVTN